MPDNINPSAPINPLYFDTMGDANGPLPHFTIRKNPPKQPLAIDVDEESQSSAVNELTQHLNEIKKTTKKVSLYESLYRESTSSYLDDSPSKETAPTKQEEISWGRKFINAVLGFFGLASQPVEASPVEQTAEETSAVQPLPVRPILKSPEEIKQAHLEKLIEAMALALQQIEDAAKEAEDLIMKGPADVALELCMTRAIKNQTKSSEEYTRTLMDLQNDTMNLLKELRERIVNIREKLEHNTDLSNVLGWVNTATTAVTLIAGTALFFTTGGVSAVLQGLSIVGGFSDGVGHLYKAHVDHTSSGQKGEIQFVSTDKGVLSGKVDNNLNDLEMLSQAIHNNHEKLIELAALKRDAFRNAIQQ